MADKLKILARLRRLDTAVASAALAHARQAEDAAAAALAQASRARLAEAACARDAAPADQPEWMATIYAGWLPASDAAIARCQRAVRDAAAAAELAAAAAAARQAAEKALATLMAERAASARAEAMRRTQLQLDELGRRLGRQS